MYADNIFRICLIVSAFLHLGLIFPWPFLNFLSRHDEAFQKIEMTYFSESRTAEVKPLSGVATKPNTDNSNSKLADTGKATEIDRQKEEIKIPKESSAKKDEKNEGAGQIKNNPAEKADEVVDIGALKGVVYEKYYLDVRDKIKSIIEKNKKGLLKESEIYVRFVVDRNGTLRDLYLYKSSGPDAGSLEKLAIKSIKEAAPFPPFSDKIKENELQFNLPVRVIRRY